MVLGMRLGLLVEVEKVGHFDELDVDDWIFLADENCSGYPDV